MLGAIIGDIAGSRFEWHNLKSKDFDLLTYHCHPKIPQFLWFHYFAASIYHSRR